MELDKSQDSVENEAGEMRFELSKETARSWRDSYGADSAPLPDSSSLIPSIEDETDRKTVNLAYKSAAIVDAFKDRLPNARELEEMTSAFGLELVSISLVQILAQITPNKYFFEQVDSLVRGLTWDERRFLSSEANLLNIQNLTMANAFKPSGLRSDRFELCVIASVDPFTPRTAWGQHVDVWRALGRFAGLTTEVIVTDKRKSLVANAEIIRRTLGEMPADRRIIATVGQGGAEFRLLVEQLLRVAPEELEGLRAWINVAGLIRGASGVERRSRGFLDRISDEFACVAKGRSATIPHQLSSANPRLRQELDLAGLPFVCVSLVGMPTATDVPAGLKHLFLQLAKQGPNDGLALFHESIVKPGYIIPVPGMSHRAETLKLAPWFVATLKALVQR